LGVSVFLRYKIVLDSIRLIIPYEQEAQSIPVDVL
jgi:hypothetical protein